MEWKLRPVSRSRKYWEDRYRRGGTSGAGSHGRLAEFKAEILNDFVAENTVTDVVEFGCGDGNQLSFAKYPRYTGLDISPTAIDLCRECFAGDDTKRFHLYGPGNDTSLPKHFRADLALSLDVVYHLTDDAGFATYLCDLFAAAKRFVIIYSTNHDETTSFDHIRHRHFTPWIAEHFPAWTLTQHISNPHPQESQADFFIYTRQPT